MANITVGQGKQFSTISAAVAAAQDGDLVAVDAGTYTNDFAAINAKITLQGIGGLAKMVATVAPPNGKGILLTNTDATIDRFEFSGAAVPDNNGAGIRYQGGDLTITNSYFHDNQNGLLANPDPAGSITIRNSEFSRNGNGDGYTHNLYVGDIARLDISDSYFHDAAVGHQIKSRADSTSITNSRIADGQNGTGSYSIDLPNGGVAVIRNNVIEQGANSDNPTIISYGVEGNVHSPSSLEISGNTFLNDLASPSARLLWNTTGVDAAITGNQVHGLTPAQYASGPATITGMTTLASDPGVNSSAPWAPAMPAPAQPPLPEAPLPLPQALPVQPLPVHAAAPGNVALSIQLSADSWQGDPVAVVRVNGEVAFNGAISAPHAAGGQVVQLGGLDAGQLHAVSVEFTNDAWAGSAATDRNLYVEDVLVNGIGTGHSQTLLRNGTANFTVDAPHLAPPSHAALAPEVVPTPATSGGALTLSGGASAGEAIGFGPDGGVATPASEDALLGSPPDLSAVLDGAGLPAIGLAAIPATMPYASDAVFF